MEPSGKRAIVVGGASGMALASVELLIGNGAKVAILDLPTSGAPRKPRRLGIGFYPCNVMDFAGYRGRDPRRRGRRWAGCTSWSTPPAAASPSARSTKDGPHPIEEFQQVVEPQPGRRASTSRASPPTS